MREKMLNNLNNALNHYNELQAYTNLLPKNIMDGATSAMEKSIPQAGNQILSLLNSVSGKQIFDDQDSAFDLMNLLRDRAMDIDTALARVPENKTIIAPLGANHMTAKDLLDHYYNGFNSHCDFILTTLTAGRLTSQNKRI